ncbi:hypothetical protein J1N35_015195 [Gossypium stocksii]|uniref:DUF4283 domain-containing protein n=1 Tax=Gossypium stocksii TaxID=47602 RepID=A0A9D3VXS8_9ROSI|nr:hypothetical protein J1N35_015195 [Gossypium stocksii]
MNSLEIVSASYSQSTDDRETKKVRFKEDCGIVDVEMIEDSGSSSNGSDSTAKVSWKQMLLEKRKHNQDERLQSVGKDIDGDLEFLEVFNPNKPYPSMVLAWIKLPSLLGFMYKTRILEEVGGLVGKVVKFDLNINSKTRGCFARMAISIDLDKPLVSQVMVNGEL